MQAKHQESKYTLTNSHGNRWYLTFNGTVVDACVAPNHEVAALLVAAYLPRGGEWEQVDAAQYRYRTNAQRRKAAS